ncbi:hypothetical protein DFQ28_005280 [Apophysomyces sp. BC1034]|nr:hypothetical protein DFQ30_004080 [Apophysomyces sp. BC1015]KAG0177921.1 hypothetical protein DFQ29_004158 [Apophysomyces sp. BC1021]KAG0188183.1 hypothetical protein DFQ28_005280 [Apophysomyces sp. BC1034]
MNPPRKYHVSVEDCPDDDDRRQNVATEPPYDLDTFVTAYNAPSDYNPHWDYVDALEERARQEKMADTMAYENATRTAKIVKEYQHQQQSA